MVQHRYSKNLYLLEQAEQLDPARRVCKDEMDVCLQQATAIYQGHEETPDTAPAPPPSKPVEPLTHHTSEKFSLYG